jgi:hypothetical protein
MTPNLNHAIAVHRERLQEIWNSPEWREANAIFHAKHPDNKCERCGKVGKIVPGHTSEDYHAMIHDPSSYVRKVRENQCQALCPTCNWQESKGKKPCPECIRQGKKTIRYIGQDQEECFCCLPDAVKERRKASASSFRRFVRLTRDAQNARLRVAYQEYKARRAAA